MEANIKVSTIALTMASIVSAGCTQVGVQIANVPAKFSHIERYEDVAYGNQSEQQLDIYTPKDVSDQSSLPVVVFFYGGRWSEGSKDMYPFLAKQYVDNGFVVVIPDYRKYPNVKFPAFVEDGAAAVAWTLNNIDNYHGNSQQLFIMGHSAGAHIGALITSNTDYLAEYKHSNQEILGFSGLSGPYDFTPEEEDLKDMFGPPNRYPEMQVTTFIEGNEAPMLLLWGGEDKLVGRQNIDRLSSKILEKQGQVTTKIYPEMAHVDMVSNMVWFLPDKAPIVKDTVQFFNHRIKDTNNGKVSSRY